LDNQCRLHTWPRAQNAAPALNRTVKSIV
jgi:hypothetical protein